MSRAMTDLCRTVGVIATLMCVSVVWSACEAGVTAASRRADGERPGIADVYVKKATWQDTMLASREALMAGERAAGGGTPLPNFGTSDYTIMAWVRTAGGGTIFSMSSASGVWAQRGGKVFFIRGRRLGFDACYIGTLAGRSVVSDGKWHHAAITYRGAGDKRLTFFLDGRPDGGRAIKADPDVAEHVVRIGLSAKNFWPPNALTGDVDEVRVYRRVLTPAEIQTRFASPPRGPEADCVGYWSFDADASDGSGNGHHGVIRGATLAAGKIGKALHLDGKGFVEIPVSRGAAARRALWRRIEEGFTDAAPRREMAWEQEDQIWLSDWPPGDCASLAARYAVACRRTPKLAERVKGVAGSVKDGEGLAAVRRLYHLSRRADQAATRLRAVNVTALRLAIGDLTQTFGKAYPQGERYLARLKAVEGSIPTLLERLSDGYEHAIEQADALVSLNAEALLANPLLDFDRLLLIRRGEKQLGLTNNWNSNSSIAKAGYDNELAVLSPVRPGGALTTLFRPDGNGSKFVGDVDLHFDADRMLFSMPGSNGRWQVFELDLDSGGAPGKPRQLPLIEQPDVDNYDACYLPDGNVMFCSTAPFVGVPCVTGSSHVCHLYLWQRDAGRIRRLTFEQDHDWCPTVLNNGRVLYLRWEYSDIPHFASRILFHMNPDGTEQMEYYGSNSYWPNSMFYARPAPNHPTRFFAIVGGHHDVPRMGELVLFDPAKGRHEADGVVQRIPGRGKPVEPILLDGLVGKSWPKFLHPYPLSAKYVIVSAKPTAQSRWGIYLVDVFDNMLLLAEVPEYALLEPIPLRKTRTPPVIASKVRPEHKDAVVYLADVYAGDGLKGVPRGTVKTLRLFTYHFAYHGVGGQVNRIGLDGPWDIKRIIGTVPVEPDGSALFRVPANTPIAVQPLDAEGKALQLMRSWMTAMPGEVLSCVGCHEPQNTTPPIRPPVASTRAPSEIKPWYGPTRGFSFKREVQPVLDRYCVGCHQGQKRADGRTIPDLRPAPAGQPPGPKNGYRMGSKFTPSYLALRRFVRSPTIESDMHLLTPCEFHADTTELVQMLSKGHHGVRLDAEAWDRLVTWIDLHAPAHGTWHEIVGKKKVFHQRDRRRAMMKLYAGRDEDPEAIYAPKAGPNTPIVPKAAPKSAARALACPGWPFDAEQAKARQKSAARRHTVDGRWERSVDLGSGVRLDLVLIPAGEFVMGDAAGYLDEGPPRRVRIDRPFWVGKFEVTNAQYARFDPRHDSRLEHGDFLQFSVEERGYPVNGPRQPVCRVSWVQAKAFCRWLSERTGERFDLPTEAEWEYACRAGTATPLWYGPAETDFSRYANLADASFKKVHTYDPWKLPSGAIYPWRPAVDGVDDHYRVSAPVGTYQPNPWALHDTHGNVAEWTRKGVRNLLRAAEPLVPADRQIVRGGSWYDRPKRARSASRRAYHPWQRVFDVGFRVSCATAPERVADVGR